MRLILFKSVSKYFVFQNGHEMCQITYENISKCDKMNLCEYCGNEFEGTTSTAYCSDDCLAKACNFALNHKKCKTCGKDFETLTEARYCSFECAYNLNDSVEVTLP